MQRQHCASGFSFRKPGMDVELKIGGGQSPSNFSKA